MGSASTIFRAILPLAGLIVLWIGARICVRLFSRRRQRRPVDPDRCKCGYTLENLLVPRCPECGRVIHFDATAEELGLTNEELERAQAARLRRRESENMPKSPGE
jgi:hypothetical protein